MMIRVKKRYEGELVPPGWSITIPLPKQTNVPYPRIHLHYTRRDHDGYYYMHVAIPPNGDLSAFSVSEEKVLITEFET